MPLAYGCHIFLFPNCLNNMVIPLDYLHLLFEMEAANIFLNSYVPDANSAIIWYNPAH